MRKAVVTSKALSVLVAASVLAGMGACLDGTGLRVPENAIGVIVSGLVHAPIRTGSGPGPAAVAPGPSAGVVYVSLPPGSVPTGVHATITNQATRLSVPAVVIAGGFDPVPILASVGDAIAVEITGFGAPVGVLLAVSTVRPLKVVRTSPSSGGRDVPLNSTIVIVFSEPIDPAALTPGAVQLLRDTTQVPGAVRFADSAHLHVAFQPAALLAPQTDYRLLVTQAVRDANGVAVGSTVAVSFTTGSAASARFVVSPTSVVFGYQTIGTTSAPKTVTLTDTSNVPEPVSFVVNGFSWTDFAATSNCPSELPAGASCTISVTFTPSAAGRRTGGVVIDADLPLETSVWADARGSGGLSLAVVPDPSGKFGKFAYVANSGSDNVSMYGINPTTGTLTPLVPPRIAAGTQPVSVVVDPSGKFAYVANFGSNNVSMFTIDTNTGALTPIGSPVPAGSGPVSVAVVPDSSGKFGKFAYLANVGSNDVSMYSIDTATGALKPIGSPVTAQFSPISVALNTSGKFAYVATDGCLDQAGSTHYINSCVLVFTINPITGALAPSGTQSTGAWSPTSIAVDPSGRFAALIDGGSNDVWMFSINATTGVLTTTAFAGTAPSPTAVAIDPSAKFAYVLTAGPTSPPCSYVGCSGVSMFAIDANGVLTSKGMIAAGSYPTSIAIDPSGKYAYVANFGSQNISMYSIGTDGTLTLMGTIGT